MRIVWFDIFFNILLASYHLRIIIINLCAVSEVNHLLSRNMTLRSGSRARSTSRARSSSRARSLARSGSVARNNPGQIYVPPRGRSLSRGRDQFRGRSASRGRQLANRGRSRSKSVGRDNRNMGDTWQHDRYTGPARSRAPLANSGPGKLMVSNLDFGVTINDIQELFSEFGRLKNTHVHYDISGRSLGTADVVYERRSDAMKALKQYDGVPLDGRPMKIEMASDAKALMNERARPRSASVGPRRVGNGRVMKRGGGGGRGGNRQRNRGASRGPPKAGRGGRGRGAGQGAGRSGRGGKRGGRGRGGAAKKVTPPNRDQLDKELDSFMKER